MNKKPYYKSTAALWESMKPIVIISTILIIISLVQSTCRAQVTFPPDTIYTKCPDTLQEPTCQSSLWGMKGTLIKEQIGCTYTALTILWVIVDWNEYDGKKGIWKHVQNLYFKQPDHDCLAHLFELHNLFRDE